MRKLFIAAVACIMTALAIALAPNPARADFLFDQGYEEFCLSGWTTTIVIAPDRSYITYQSYCGDFGGHGEGGVAFPWRF